MGGLGLRCGWGGPGFGDPERCDVVLEKPGLCKEHSTWIKERYRSASSMKKKNANLKLPADDGLTHRERVVASALQQRLDLVPAVIQWIQNEAETWPQTRATITAALEPDNEAALHGAILIAAEREEIFKVMSGNLSGIYRSEGAFLRLRIAADTETARRKEARRPAEQARQRESKQRRRDADKAATEAAREESFQAMLAAREKAAAEAA